MITNTYFERYGHKERYISEELVEDTFLIVVIPVYKEENLLNTLHALKQCSATNFPVEVILVVNHPENATQEIKNLSKKTVLEIQRFREENKSSFLTFQIIKAFDLPPKKAGVGLARKIGMDEAAFRLNGIDQDGVIVCFDADSTCDSNYLEAIETHFLKNRDAIGASIHYEHPIQHQDLNEAIILYELHLRYYIQGLRFAEYPYAFHTIGSSMAVRSSVYQKQGGMNQRKAGEDFYFLHKIIPLNNFLVINNTKVIPSARKSDRVPFGTGRAMAEYENSKKDLSYSYNFEVFKDLKNFLSQLGESNFPKCCSPKMQDFIISNNYDLELEKIKTQAKDQAHFQERFLQWFHGFRILKCVHFLRDNYHPNQELIKGVSALFSEISALKNHQNETSAKKQLLLLRAYERNLTN